MNCDDATAKLYNYLDGETRAFRRWRVRRHLRVCFSCEEGAKFEARLKMRIKEGCREDLPRELEDKIRAFIRQQNRGTEA